MDSSLKFFLIGLLTGISTLFLVNMDYEELWAHPEKYFSIFLFVGAKSWQLIFLIIIVVNILFLAIEPIKKRFTRKQYLPFPFLGGNGCAFLSFQIIAIIFELLL